ncbi:hypothetical protein [Streptomyces longisporus]|uniref:Uncharacterized protein n=1 Tax=Streptomyces longisporus TaxID=1948 RepID=A0ABN3NKB0_STRLO
MPQLTPLPVPAEAPCVPGRPRTGAQVAGVVAFPVIGGVLAVTGMPVGDVLALVSGCGVIGAASVTACGRLAGRPVAGRLAASLAAAAVRVAREPRP